MIKRIPLAAVLALTIAASPARAGEVLAGLFAHDVDAPTSLSGQERGADLQLGWRGSRIEALRAIGAPSPYVFGAVNLAGDTSFAAAGFSWKIGHKFYLRPGIGLAVHSGRDHPTSPERIDFGSRVLFEPELGFGVQVSDRLSVEASWVHLSHATIFGRQNPGSDNFGVRLNFGM